jgi:hypothetical protein
MEAAGNHEVENEPQVVLDSDGNAFADAAKCADGAAFDAGEWRLDGAEKKGAGEADAFEGLAEDAGVEGRDIGSNVREFRHGYKIAGIA